MERRVASPAREEGGRYLCTLIRSRAADKAYYTLTMKIKTLNAPTYNDILIAKGEGYFKGKYGAVCEGTIVIIVDFIAINLLFHN